MRLQVFVDRRRLFVTDVEPGGVSACVHYIKEMVKGEIVVALDSEKQNVTYLIRRGEPR